MQKKFENSEEQKEENINTPWVHLLRHVDMLPNVFTMSISM